METIANIIHIFKLNINDLPLEEASAAMDIEITNFVKKLIGKTNEGLDSILNELSPEHRALLEAKIEAFREVLKNLIQIQVAARTGVPPTETEISNGKKAIADLLKHIKEVKSCLNALGKSVGLGVPLQIFNVFNEILDQVCNVCRDMYDHFHKMSPLEKCATIVGVTLMVTGIILSISALVSPVPDIARLLIGGAVTAAGAFMARQTMAHYNGEENALQTLQRLGKALVDLFKTVFSLPGIAVKSMVNAFEMYRNSGVKVEKPATEVPASKPVVVPA